MKKRETKSFIIPIKESITSDLVKILNHKGNTPFFLYKQFIFDSRPQSCLSFSKNYPQKLFSNCLVDGLLTSIV